MDATLREVLAYWTAACALWFGAIAAGYARQYWHEWKRHQRAMAALLAKLERDGEL